MKFTTTLLISFLILFSTPPIFSQIAQPFECGVQASDDEPHEHGNQDCIDIADIIENCTPIYINVNVHFFLDDNCEGSLASDSDDVSDPNEAYNVAEEMINLSNNFLRK